jgi:amidase
MERLRTAGYIRRPSIDRVRSLARDQHMELNEEEARDIAALVDQTLRSIERLDDFPVPEIAVKYPDRDRGRRPEPGEDPCNAFIRKCLVRGAQQGPLAGKTIGLKDNIRLAGIPMTNASRLMHDYVPSVDAIVAERLLDAGGTIVGKLNMDNFSMGGTSETGHYGAVRNPHNPDFSAGGSSGGSGAAVAAGAVDIALGVDQGGSARIPAAWCGVACIKATHGLVPSFGITYLDHSIDFVCPMARTVEEVAVALEAIAGDDPRDPQWVRGEIRTAAYASALAAPIAGLRVGIVKEAFEWPDSEADVNESVRAAADRLQGEGAAVGEVSLPWWQICPSILLGVLCHSNAVMVDSDLEGYFRGGLCDPAWQQAFGLARRAGSNDFPALLKVQMILGPYLRQEYCSVYFSKAQNARLAVTGELDRALDRYDVLVTPTVQTKAVRLTTQLKPGSWEGRGAIDCNKNCCPLNLTGHPALTVPCGFGENGLPIGIQLIGRRWDEAVLFRTAAKIAR